MLFADEDYRTELDDVEFNVAAAFERVQSVSENPLLIENDPRGR